MIVSPEFSFTATCISISPIMMITAIHFTYHTAPLILPAAMISGLFLRCEQDGGNSGVSSELIEKAPLDAPLQRQAQPKAQGRWGFVGGVIFTLIIATLGLGLAQLPGFALVGPLACSIIIA